MFIRPDIAAAAAMAALLVDPAVAGQVSSEYTTLEVGKDCTVFAAAPDGEGDWANLTCNGFRGYPVLIQYGDLRESLHYGFPPDGDLGPRWESFGGFNSTGETIEWRIEEGEHGLVPFATIHRWTVSNSDGDGETQVLVVEKVAQPAGEGCVVGYVVATGNPDANSQAREVADDFARHFACRADNPEIRLGSVELPPTFVAQD